MPKGEIPLCKPAFGTTVDKFYLLFSTYLIVVRTAVKLHIGSLWLKPILNLLPSKLPIPKWRLHLQIPHCLYRLGTMGALHTQGLVARQMAHSRVSINVNPLELFGLLEIEFNSGKFLATKGLIVFMRLEKLNNNKLYLKDELFSIESFQFSLRQHIHSTNLTLSLLVVQARTYWQKKSHSCSPSRIFSKCTEVHENWDLILLKTSSKRAHRRPAYRSMSDMPATRLSWPVLKFSESNPDTLRIITLTTCPMLTCSLAFCPTSWLIAQPLLAHQSDWPRCPSSQSSAQ